MHEPSLKRGGQLLERGDPELVVERLGPLRADPGQLDQLRGHAGTRARGRARPPAPESDPSRRSRRASRQGRGLCCEAPPSPDPPRRALPGCVGGRVPCGPRCDTRAHGTGSHPRSPSDRRGGQAAQRSRRSRGLERRQPSRRPNSARHRWVSSRRDANAETGRDGIGACPLCRVLRITDHGCRDVGADLCGPPSVFARMRRADAPLRLIGRVVRIA